MSVLHVVLEISEEEFPFNELGVACAGRQDVAFCTFFRPKVEVPPSIVMFEGDGSIGGFMRALKEAQEAKNYDAVHAHSPHVGFLLLVSNFLGRLGMDATVFTVHHSYRGSRLKLRNRLLLLPVFASFSHIVCVSEASLRSFPRIYRRLGGRRLRTIPNGVDIARVDRVLGRQERCGSPDAFTVVSIGRLIEIKNPAVVLNSFLVGMSTQGRAKLVFVGKGYLEGQLKACANSGRSDVSIQFTGLVPRQQVYERLAGADLFVSASRSEGLPLAVLEAMACRCPVVLSDIPPHRDIVADADFIPLIQPDDVSGFAKQVSRFREMSPVERQQIGARCRALIDERFSLAVTHKRYEAVYREVSRNAGSA